MYILLSGVLFLSGQEGFWFELERHSGGVRWSSKDIVVRTWTFFSGENVYWGREGYYYSWYFKRVYSTCIRL